MKKKLLGHFYTGVTAFAALLIILIIAVILFDIFRGGLAKLSWEFLTAPPREGMTAGGIFPAIYGTFILVILMSVVGLPFGIITAIYLSEYTTSQNRFARMVRFAISNLASVPSIVFGLFGLGFFVQFVGAGLDRVLAAEDEVIWGKLL
jgi:phosphate ABC transporter membrane protein 2, PhoT family (TC 3.A.1.7.1)